ncbi:MAG: hypothetical protein HC889_07685 [Synechococcaceae cyanobacterium SM1_2_3]|nr:hypothetical protein [Synechococcaceae cyanobacterium SM1_2_3]
MNRAIGGLLLVALLTSGCNNDDSNDSAGPVVRLPALSSGSYTVTASGDELSFGESFYDSRGNSYLLLAADDRTPAQIMVVSVGGAVSRIPPPAQDVSISYPSSSAGGFSALNLISLPGRYTALVANQMIEFTLAANGAITAGASGCKLNGALDATKSFDQAISASITFSSCSGIAGSYTGIAFARQDLRPASFRIVAHNGTSVVDLLAF